MPVRGKGHYKRPWHLTWYDPRRDQWFHSEFHSEYNARDRERQLQQTGALSVRLAFIP